MPVAELALTMCATPLIRRRVPTAMSATEQTRAAIAFILNIPLHCYEHAGVAMPTYSSPEKRQIFLHVKEMTSRQSAEAVMGALLRLDGRATVRIDLPMRRVEIDPTSAEPAAFRDAIAKAGYTTVRQRPSSSAFA